MGNELLIDRSAEKPLAGEELRQRRRLAGFSQPGLERCAGLTAGRVTNVENGRARFRPREWARVRSLLLEEMQARAAEIAECLRSVEPARAEASAADHPG